VPVRPHPSLQNTQNETEIITHNDKKQTCMLEIKTVSKKHNYEETINDIINIKYISHQNNE